jgi:ABC-type nitrate/sulfonate/bicarbonate transport system substrate-binding protein
VNGLFAEHGVDVEILDPSGGPDNVVRVGSGDSDFALTSVQHYLSARAEHGDIPARFVAMVVQRSPIGALVPATSPVRRPADLAGCRVGGDAANPQVIEFMATLDHLGIERPAFVEVAAGNGPAALARGEVDAIVALVDAMPRRRRQAGIALRAVRIGRDDVYGSGVIATDRLPDELVAKVRAGVVAALEAQRLGPDAGLAQMADRYGDDRTDDAPEGWRMLQEFVFTDAPTGSMDADRWRTTIEFLCHARGLDAPAPESVYRPQFLVPVPSGVASRA